MGKEAAPRALGAAWVGGYLQGAEHTDISHSGCKGGGTKGSGVRPGSLSSRTLRPWLRRDCPAAQPLQERMHRPDHRIFQSETWLDAIQLGAPPPMVPRASFPGRLTPPSRPSVATGWGGRSHL